MEEKLFQKMMILVKQIQYYFDISEQESIEDWCEKEEDQLYQEYWHLVFDHFKEDTIKKAESKIGTGNFITCEFVEALKEAWESEPRKVDAYQGYQLIRSTDLFDCITYFIYDMAKQQIGESYDYYDDETAIKCFRKAIDQNPNNPYFEQ